MIDVVVRRSRRQDWRQVSSIYSEGIATGHATFVRAAPTWEEWDAAHLPEHRLSAHPVDDPDAVLAWAAVSPTSGQLHYAGAVEHSIYVAEAARGHGLGSILLRSLIESTEAGSIWTLRARVFPDNVGSLALHAAHGFREVGRFERAGLMSYGPLAGRWRDVVLLERRSAVVGL